MAQSWCRLYGEFATDHKVQTLSEVDQRRFIMLLCLKTTGELDHIIEFGSETELAYALRVSVFDISQTKTALLSRKMIDKNWNITAWNKRQFVSDVSTERVKRYRKRNVSNPLQETLQKSCSNGEEPLHETLPPHSRVQIQKQIQKETPIPPEGEAARSDDLAVSDSTKSKEMEKQILSDFEVFWKPYPRKIAKVAALKRFTTLYKAKKLPPINELVKALNVHMNQWSREGRDNSKLPHATTWLNEERWNDELSEPTLPLLEANPSAPPIKTFDEEEAERRAKIKEDERKRVAAGGKSDRVLFMENRIKTFKMDVSKCWGTWGDECEQVWGKDWKDVVTKIAEGGA